MEPFDVYPLMNIAPCRAKGCWVWDTDGTPYLDLYGGHAVISIGHANDHFVKSITEQVSKIAFYSNSVINPLQQELARKLGELSGYPDFRLFLCNSGAEANENALKLASFHTGKNKVIAFNGSFHGRTSLAVAATHDAKIQAPVNQVHDVQFVPFNDQEAFLSALDENVCAVIIEGIQGVGGVREAESDFLKFVGMVCSEKEIVFIVDEVQSGYGRTGQFFAHQAWSVEPDLITVAKGMGNGFPIAGVLISPKFRSAHGMLGTTFGGSHLACAAGISVLDEIKEKQLMKAVREKGNYWINELKQLQGIKEIRGRGLIIGLEFDFPIEALKKNLLKNHRIIAGQSGKNTLRLLPPMTIEKREIDLFTWSLKYEMQKNLATVTA
jgi:acetylornithine/N-succinyldiaminopimelate aminotransferase